MYPPGQFSPWNSAALRNARAADRSALGAEAMGDAPEPAYPLLAVSDPAADATATQTWSVLDEADLAGEWTSKRTDGSSGPGLAGAGLAGTASGGPFAPADGYPDASDGYPDASDGYPDSADGYPDAGGPAGPAGYAAAAGVAPPAPAGTDPGRPRPGGRLAARRDRQAAQAQGGTGPQDQPGDGPQGSWSAADGTGGAWGAQQDGPGYWAAQAPSGTLAAPQHGTGAEFGTAAPGSPAWEDGTGWGDRAGQRTGDREAVPGGTGPGGTGRAGPDHGPRPVAASRVSRGRRASRPAAHGCG